MQLGLHNKTTVAIIRGMTDVAALSAALELVTTIHAIARLVEANGIACGDCARGTALSRAYERRSGERVRYPRRCPTCLGHGQVPGSLAYRWIACAPPDATLVTGMNALALALRVGSRDSLVVWVAWAVHRGHDALAASALEASGTLAQPQDTRMRFLEDIARALLATRETARRAA